MRGGGATRRMQAARTRRCSSRIALRFIRATPQRRRISSPLMPRRRIATTRLTRGILALT